MNYDKKRKRQSGRQKRQKYNEWWDKYREEHAEISKLIKDGILPPINFTLESQNDAE